jgi:hypothetical protein
MIGSDLLNNGAKSFGMNKVFHEHPDAKGVIVYDQMGGAVLWKIMREVNKGNPLYNYLSK